MALTVAAGLTCSLLDGSHCWCCLSGAKWHFENGSDVREDAPALSAHWPFCPRECVYVGKSPACLSTKEQSVRGKRGGARQLPVPTLYFPGTDQPGVGDVVGNMLTCSGRVCLNFGTFWLSAGWWTLPSPHPASLLISVLPGAAGWWKGYILLHTEFKEMISFYCLSRSGLVSQSLVWKHTFQHVCVSSWCSLIRFSLTQVRLETSLWSTPFLRAS